METEQIIDLAEALELDWRWYSGRGMCGDKCFAITTDRSEAYVVASLIQIAVERVVCTEESNPDMYQISELCEMLAAAKSDSMGLGIVVYWPEIEKIDREPVETDV